jgi:membrane fusion protein, multidrug efflux system
MQTDKIDAKESAAVGVAEPVSQTANSVAHPERRHWRVWLVILPLFIVLFVVVRQRATSPANARLAARAALGPITVVTATAKLGSIPVYLDAIGTVTPVYTDSITAQVTGVITAVDYREGQFVHKGDLLIDLDSRLYAAQLEQAKGTLEHDQNLLAEAQMDLVRYQQAWARNGIPRQTLEDQQKLVLQYQGTVKYDEGTVHYDQVQLVYCHITSPIDGRVGLRLVDPGNLVIANSTIPVVAITQIQPITVVFTLAEDNIDDVLDQVRRGKNLSVEAWDRQMQTRLGRGQLIAIDNQIDTTTGTVKLRASFSNRNNALFPNQFVNTRLLVKTLQKQILIPSPAIQHNGNAAFVYVIENGCAKMTRVKPGTSEGGLTAVEGIQPGQVVANSSFERLQNGSRVRISSAKLPSTSTEANKP